jgi:hypothetical protein
MLHINKISDTIFSVIDDTKGQDKVIYSISAFSIIATEKNEIILYSPLHHVTYVALFDEIRFTIEDDPQDFNTVEELAILLTENQIGNFSNAGGTASSTSGSKIANFLPNHKYRAGDIILHNNALYVAKVKFESTDAFVSTDWEMIYEDLSARVDAIDGGSESSGVIYNLTQRITAIDGGSVPDSGAIYNLQQEIEGLHGKSARLNSSDFGAIDITSSTDQTRLTDYAIAQLNISSADNIPNLIAVHNTSDGHVYMYDTLTSKWIDNGIDSVTIANTVNPGIVLSSEEDYDVSVNADGTMTVNNLETEIVQFPKTINGIPQDGNRDIKTIYSYDSETEFEADKDNIPIGAIVIKNYEYPDTIAGFMITPDYSKMESINRIPSNNGTWIADKDGYVYLYCSGNGTSNREISFHINSKRVGYFYVNSSSIAIGFGDTYSVKKGDIVSIDATISVSNMWCYYIPPLFIKKELPIIVEKNGSYSTEEVKTQEKWHDGSAIYRQTFILTFDKPNEPITKTLISGNIKKIIRDEVNYSNPGSDLDCCGHTRYAIGISNFGTIIYSLFTYIKNQSLFVVGNINDSAYLNGATYTLTAYYTKINEN